MKVIYVAGKYRDGTSLGVLDNIHHATQEAYKLWNEGWAVICPHMNTAHFNDIPSDVILPGDLELLNRCDAIYLLKGWQGSEGAQQEYLCAVTWHKEIIFEVEE